MNISFWKSLGFILLLFALNISVAVLKTLSMFPDEAGSDPERWMLNKGIYGHSLSNRLRVSKELLCHFFLSLHTVIQRGSLALAGMIRIFPALSLDLSRLNGHCLSKCYCRGSVSVLFLWCSYLVPVPQDSDMFLEFLTIKITDDR